jgi:membrane protease YdiL (CAAX protease family)
MSGSPPAEPGAGADRPAEIASASADPGTADPARSEAPPTGLAPAAQGPRAAGCGPLVPLLIAAVALGVVVLAPSLYSDPNGLDPYTLRTSGVALALLAISLVVPGLARARLVLVSLVAITLSWSAFLSAPGLLGHAGVYQTGDQANFNASAAWLGVTVVILCLVWLVLRRDHPLLRVLHLGWPAAAFAVGGTALFFLVFLLIPAPLLGREGVAIPALLRDAPWLVPANMLQSAAQELQFRGLLLGSLERLTSPLVANACQAVVFGLAHLAIVYQGPIAPFVPLTMLLGFLLGWVTQKTGSIWPAIVVHGVADVVVTLVVLPGLYGY